MTALPDPRAELRVLSTTTLPGANYWARRPVSRLDLGVGAYDQISSAEVPGFAERLLTALPGLHEHRCSVGRPGGFALRLRRGTFAPHIVEHVALELQSLAGYDVGYGRARGGSVSGEYTVVVEHQHAGVGRRSLTLGLDIVGDAFAGADPPRVEQAIEELRAAGRQPDPAPPPDHHVDCAIIGGGDLEGARVAALDRAPGADIVTLNPACVLTEGLPYATSRAGVILDQRPDAGLPSHFTDPARIRRLYTTVAEAIVDGGWLVVPAGDEELHRIADEYGLRLATFGPPRRGDDAAQRASEDGGRIRMPLPHGAEDEPGGAAAMDPVRLAGFLVARILRPDT